MNYEPILKRWNSTSLSGRADRSDALLLTFHPGRIADSPGEHLPSGFDNEGVAQEPPQRRHFGAVAPIEILSGPGFLKQLHREMRRADRSKSPLSVALLHVNGQPDDAAAPPTTPDRSGLVRTRQLPRRSGPRRLRAACAVRLHMRRQAERAEAYIHHGLVPRRWHRERGG